jgi:hypothetical protein
MHHFKMIEGFIVGFKGSQVNGNHKVEFTSEDNEQLIKSIQMREYLE